MASALNPSSIVRFLRRLGRSRSSLKSDRAAIAALSKRTAEAVARFDFDSAAEELAKWFLTLLQTQPRSPRKKLRALNFGLFEREGGCTLYVAGSSRHEAGNSDWAMEPDWWPNGRFAPSERLSELWNALPDRTIPRWVVIQAVTIVLVRMLFQGPTMQASPKKPLRNVIVASGFDDGDLYEIKINA